MSAQRTDRNGRFWTTRPLLRIRRLGFRVPPSAPGQRPLTRSGRGLSAALGSHAGSHGHISAAEQSPAHRLSRRPLVTFEQVPVHVLGDSEVTDAACTSCRRAAGSAAAPVAPAVGRCTPDSGQASRRVQRRGEAGGCDGVLLGERHPHRSCRRPTGCAPTHASSLPRDPSRGPCQRC